MPITLENPISRPAVTRAEITRFHVDIVGMSLSVGLQYSTDTGEPVNQAHVQVSLRDATGAPRFTSAEYTAIKQMIYRMLIEDGLVSGEPT